MGPSSHQPASWGVLARAGFVLATIAAASAGVAVDAAHARGPVELAYLVPALYAGYRFRGIALKATLVAIAAAYGGALTFAFAHPHLETIGPRLGVPVGPAWLPIGLLARSRAEVARLRTAVNESTRIDALTAALNRRGLADAAERELPAAARSGLAC